MSVIEANIRLIANATELDRADAMGIPAEGDYVFRPGGLTRKFFQAVSYYWITGDQEEALISIVLESGDLVQVEHHPRILAELAKL